MKKDVCNILIFFILGIFPFFTEAQPNKRINFTDSLGRRQGYWKKYVNDSLKYEGFFVNDKPIGEFKYYYYQGKLKAITTYSDSGRVAKTIMYFIDGKKNAEGTYVDRKKDGLWLYYGLNQKVISEENYKMGSKEGCWKFYYDDGKILRIENYKNDKLNGEWMEFYADSILRIKTFYMDDKLNGKFQFFYPSGKILLTGYYKNDLKDGEWMFFNENGLGEKKLTYKEGILLKKEIVVIYDGNVKYIDEKKIAYCYSSGKESTIKLTTGEVLTTTYTIDDMDRLLDQFNFFRINNDYIIAIWSVKNRKTFDKDYPVVELKPDIGKQVFVQKEKIEGFMSWIGIIKYD